jgi:hypothetical protein
LENFFKKGISSDDSEESDDSLVRSKTPISAVDKILNNRNSVPEKRKRANHANKPNLNINSKVT